MNMHKNARLMPQGRRLLVQRITEQGSTVGSAAGAAGLSERQAYRWLARYRAGGTAALIDRSLAPKRRPHQGPDGVADAVLAAPLSATSAVRPEDPIEPNRGRATKERYICAN